MAEREYPRLRFALAVVAAALRGKLRFARAHQPPAGHTVSPDLVGVGVAAAQDPAVDDWIIERLREAAIRRVRLDFTPADEGGPADRLLCRLLDANVAVTLHLIQPRDEARRMPAKAVCEAWRAFVARTLDRYGERIEIVEFGSTINRQTWCGHTVAGFLAMWDAAWREARLRKLTIAGPSVTDFEPIWNIGLLALLRDRGQLPDIHTDNLFAERATEPERFDPKVLGRRMVSWGKYNLVKKARLLARIGADSGVPRLFSPAAFWTLPRIERRLPDGEQKQADYLARYLLLCAASGALDRAWWGPLICHREGLVDNGMRPYPKLERITHYASVEGDVGDLRIRPAFLALKSICAFVRGACYEGAIATGSGLEIHAFRSSTALVHAVWTINGGAASLPDIYSFDDLAEAQVIDRDGIAFADAGKRVIGESPVYLIWPATRAVTLPISAQPLPGVAMALHNASARGLRHYRFSDDNWHGIVLARSADEADQLVAALHPARLQMPKRDTALRHARNAIWTVADPRRSDRLLVIKRPVKMHLHKRLLDRFKPSKGLRSWNGTCELLRHGIAAAQPVAWFELRGDHTLMKNFYVCEHVAAPFTAREMMMTFASGSPAFCGVNEHESYRQLAQFVLRMHGCGILFRDLSGGNVLIESTESDRLEFTLIDTGRIRMFERLGMRARLSDLARICHKLHSDGRTAFMAHYLGRHKTAHAIMWRLAFFLYDLKVSIKRTIGRKAIKGLIRKLSNNKGG